MLRWARDWRGTSVEEAAARIKKSPAEILDWEAQNGEYEPTVTQARRLAELYQRPFLEFFLPSPPEVTRPNLVPDFRLYHGAPHPTEDRYFQDIQRWAKSLRVNALDLYEELSEEPPVFPEELFKSIKSDPEYSAALAREATGFKLEEQIGLSASQGYRLPDLVRNRIESIGVLVAKAGALKNYSARGICLAQVPLPIIVYSQEYPGAQAFTLAHELAHIMIGESGIIGPFATQGESKVQDVENWCDNFAGAFLMPRKAVLALRHWPHITLPEISDEELSEVATAFRVSAHAALVRLVRLGIVHAKFYWDKKRMEFLKAEGEYKSYGRSNYYGRRYRNKVGDLYTGLVLEAWKLGRISNHNAAEYLGIKNLQHLNVIRDEFKV